MNKENQNIECNGNWMMLYNNGELPENWTIQTLTEKHASEPANPDIARAFFRAGYIEIWGRGISNTIRYCNDAGLPVPYFRNMGPGLAMVFETKTGNSNFGRIEKESSPESSPESSFGETTLRIFRLIQNDPYITATEISEIITITKRGVLKNKKKLKEQNKIKRIGYTKGGYWQVIDKVRKENEKI